MIGNIIFYNKTPYEKVYILLNLHMKKYVLSSIIFKWVIYFLKSSFKVITNCQHNFIFIRL